jgi:hypothetical protein
VEAAKIILFATFAAIAYGVLHDQVTAHLCVEYFTVAHPRIFPTENPALLALGWGILATWWVGLALGILLALAARAGSAPKLGLAQFRRPILLLMLVTALAALASGLVGASVASLVSPAPGGPIPAEKFGAFLAVAFAHEASYAVGTLAGVMLAGRTLLHRRRSYSPPRSSS